LRAACIIQARLGSTRLPAKVLLPLPTGRTVLEEVIHRCQQIEMLCRPELVIRPLLVVVAIPETPDNDELAHVAGRAGAIVVRGPEHDVLARYVKAAEAVGADVIMRITADCPLLDPQTCEAVLELFQKSGADYASNVWPARHYPQGWDCEVFTMQALRKAHAEATDAYDREHVTPFLQRSPDINRVMLKDMQDRSHIRWTLDTAEDYEAICAEFERREREAA
jgi:spore coat polysaccharide biosynthesis protein SpsF